MWRLSKAHTLVLEWRCQEETSRRAAVAMALRHVQALHKYASLKCVGNSSWACKHRARKGSASDMLMVGQTAGLPSPTLSEEDRPR